MAHVSEARQPVLRVARISARLAAILLLFVWVGPVTFDQLGMWQLLKWAGAPEPASAGPRFIHAGEALTLERGTRLKLRLSDNSTIEGRFLGRAVLDSAVYVSRFDSYVRTAPFVPLTLGETLYVALRDGREWTAPFAGYGELTLLLRGSDGLTLRVPFEFARTVLRANGERVEPNALARAFRSGALPSAEALVMEDRDPIGSDAERWASALHVPVEDIRWASARLAHLDNGGEAAGYVVLGVLLAAVLFYLLINASMHQASSSCQSANFDAPTLGWAHVHLTDRPFDRSRGCFVGDEIAVAEPWPASIDESTRAEPRATMALAP